MTNSAQYCSFSLSGQARIGGTPAPTVNEDVWTSFGQQTWTEFKINMNYMVGQEHRLPVSICSGGVDGTV